MREGTEVLNARPGVKRQQTVMCGLAALSGAAEGPSKGAFTGASKDHAEPRAARRGSWLGAFGS